MTHYSTDFAAQIRNQGFRLTPQRHLILDAVCEGGGHTTLDEIYGRVQAKSPAINRSTLYRTLEFLQELHLIVAASISGHTVYEITHASPHHHLVCRQCGAQVEVSEEALTPTFAAIAQQHGFAVDTDHLVLTGLCQACQATGI